MSMVVRPLAYALLLLCFASPAWAQDPGVALPSPTGQTAAPPPLKVYLDCSDRDCDFNYLRQEIAYLDYVRDRKDAEVHVLVRTQNTGSGGRKYDLEYIGLGRFSGQDRTSTFTTSGTDTSDERRKEFARVFTLGLVPYLLSTPAAEYLGLQFDAPTQVSCCTEAASDPWNYWIFRVGASTQFDGERSTKSREFQGNLSANRTTDAWKISFSADGQYNENDFILSDGRTVTSTSNDYTVRSLVIKSLGRDHWGAAFRVQIGADTRTNQDRATRVAAGLEYSVFPYDQSTERALVMQYTLGVNGFKYAERTIYDKLQETVADQQFLTRLALRQPWGSTTISFTASSYLHDLSLNRYGVDGRIDVRLFRGFTLNINGNASQVHNQLYLQAGEATDEEILLKRRQLQTSYRYRLSVGFSYQFGSIFNNVVNPRFDAR
jgi:hypothetical protein